MSGFKTLVPPSFGDPVNNVVPPAATSFNAFPTTTESSDSLPSLDSLYSNILNQQLSRILSAPPGTTLTTAITPRQSIQAETSTVTTDVPKSTTTNSTSEESIFSAPTVRRLTDIGIAFGVFVAVTVIIVGIVLCIRHKKSSKPKKSRSKDGPKPLDYSDWRQVNLSEPSMAHIPKDIGVPPPPGTARTPPEHTQWMPPPAYPTQQNQDSRSYPRGGYR
ncbi:hypothetical protein EDB80DRAFT_876008 [Ilyonectria destructans]|nr:hypothetical protein EDB80DRAFT_876008 [Ilyonectria destructans]